MACRMPMLGVEVGQRASRRVRRQRRTATQPTLTSRFVNTPASETMMSPRLKFRYFRGFTGTGFAPPRIGACAIQSMTRQKHRHERIDVLDRIPGQAAQHEGGVVALLQCGVAVCVFVRDDREQQHRHEQQEILKLQRRPFEAE